VLQKKSRGRLIHVSDFICEATGRLVRRDAGGKIVDDARKIIFPGSNGDAWWDTTQLIEQVKNAIRIHEAVHPTSTALFIFDQSSAHASLPPDALRAFDMNKTDGGKQRHQKDTIIPDSNPVAELRGRVQNMTNSDGTPKGLESVLKERGFDLYKSGKKMKAKCSPVCPLENTDCCMARLLSRQDDFNNQLSMLETIISNAGHKCIFLPKFHCELNPIEMVCTWSFAFNYFSLNRLLFSTGDGVNIATVRLLRPHLTHQKNLQSKSLIPALWMSCVGSSTAHGAL